MTTFDCDGRIGTNVTEGEGRGTNAPIDSDAAANSSLGTGGRDRLPVSRNGTHASVDGLVPLLALLSATLTPHFDISGDAKADNDEQGHDYGSGDFPSREVLECVLHDSYGAVGMFKVCRGRSAGGRSSIGHIEDGTSGISAEERGLARANDRELKADGCGIIPPLRLEGCLIRTGRIFDILEGMDAGASSGGIEEDVDRGAV